ncbi:9247_t:CDS:1 [Gigaspora rosea]|nr:9247_t:CDS:1 [Gigaspora rosea]
MGLKVFLTDKLNQNPLTEISDKNGRSILMPNYYFGNIDNSVAANICVDKDITAKVLHNSGIFCVEHELFNKGEDPDSVVESIIKMVKKQSFVGDQK